MAEERREKFETSSGIELPNDFNPHNTQRADQADLGSPGEFPYTRGVRRNMYRGKFWTMRQYAGFATAQESNARYKYLLSQGTTGLSVAFDLPTQIGLDSDDSLRRASPEKWASLSPVLTTSGGLLTAFRSTRCRRRCDKLNGVKHFCVFTLGRPQAGCRVRQGQRTIRTTF